MLINSYNPLLEQSWRKFLDFELVDFNTYCPTEPHNLVICQGNENFPDCMNVVNKLKLFGKTKIIVVVEINPYPLIGDCSKYLNGILMHPDVAHVVFLADEQPLRWNIKTDMVIYPALDYDSIPEWTKGDTCFGFMPTQSWSSGFDYFNELTIGLKKEYSCNWNMEFLKKMTNGKIYINSSLHDAISWGLLYAMAARMPVASTLTWMSDKVLESRLIHHTSHSMRKCIENPTISENNIREIFPEKVFQNKWMSLIEDATK